MRGNWESVVTWCLIAAWTYWIGSVGFEIRRLGVCFLVVCALQRESITVSLNQAKVYLLSFEGFHKFLAFITAFNRIHQLITTESNMSKNTMMYPLLEDNWIEWSQKSRSWRSAPPFRLLYAFGLEDLEWVYGVFEWSISDILLLMLVMNTAFLSLDLYFLSTHTTEDTGSFACRCWTIPFGLHFKFASQLNLL